MQTREILQFIGWALSAIILGVLVFTGKATTEVLVGYLAGLAAQFGRRPADSPTEPPGSPPDAV